MKSREIVTRSYSHVWLFAPSLHQPCQCQQLTEVPKASTRPRTDFNLIPLPGVRKPSFSHQQSHTRWRTIPRTRGLLQFQSEIPELTLIVANPSSQIRPRAAPRKRLPARRSLRKGRTERRSPPSKANPIPRPRSHWRLSAGQIILSSVPSLWR